DSAGTSSPSSPTTTSPHPGTQKRTVPTGCASSRSSAAARWTPSVSGNSPAPPGEEPSGQNSQSSPSTVGSASSWAAASTGPKTPTSCTYSTGWPPKASSKSINSPNASTAPSVPTPSEAGPQACPATGIDAATTLPPVG